MTNKTLQKFYPKGEEPSQYQQNNLEAKNKTNAQNGKENLRELYEKLCRGDLEPSPRKVAELQCRYVTETSPFLRIAPLKLEEANLSPYIVIYHGVLSYKEIEVLKNKSKPIVSTKKLFCRP